MTSLRTLLLSLSLIAAGYASLDEGTAASEGGARLTASQQLNNLLASSDEAALARNPLQALARGDLRYADRIGDYLKETYYQAEREAAIEDLAALARIDRRALSADEKISYDAFAWQRQMDVQQLQPQLLNLIKVRPINHFNGLHLYFAQISSGEGRAPFETVRDYENGLSRIDDFVRYLDRCAQRLDEGLKAGLVEPRLVMANVADQLDSLIVADVEQSSFYRPLLAPPASVSEGERERLRMLYRAKIHDSLYPALVRLRDYIRLRYLPHARETVGLLHLKGGDRLYRYLVHALTTVRLSPQEIHRMGLDEVARLHAEMERVKTEVGFRGSLKSFFEHLRTDPRFQPSSREAYQAGFEAIGQRVGRSVPQLFSRTPETPIILRPVPALREKGASRGSYQPGTPDGSRSGVFYFNAYDLPSRSTLSMETLFLHEAVPGHHFQISLAQENAALPALQRFSDINAFVEGWGLYAESLGRELGMYTDPYQYFGYLDSELFRAIRLVVDTGIHSKGWARDTAIQYILDNSSRGRSNAVAETERYIATPGQALGYKIGALKIRELRKRAEELLGDRFDVRDFHEQILGSGGLPLEILEKKVNDWIETERRR